MKQAEMDTGDRCPGPRARRRRLDSPACSGGSGGRRVGEVVFMKGGAGRHLSLSFVHSVEKSDVTIISELTSATGLCLYQTEFGSLNTGLPPSSPRGRSSSGPSAGASGFPASGGSAENPSPGERGLGRLPRGGGQGDIAAGPGGGMGLSGYRLRGFFAWELLLWTSRA
jgi:hypothetical protein